MMQLTNISDIKNLLHRHGFRFSKSMGQNFLTAAWVPERITEEAGIDKNTGVLEIGPGIGALTVHLAEAAGRVVSLELDKTLEPILAETLAGRENVEVLFADALKTDLKALAVEKLDGLRPVVCSNLPYNITTPVLTALLEAGCFESVTVMVQKEVARRICAPPGGGDYGAFSVYVQWHTEPRILFDVSPGCFIPQPKVSSSVIRLDKRGAPPAHVENEAFFFKVVRAAFSQRRKTLVNALSAGLGRPKNMVENAVKAAGLDIMARGETLSIQNFAELTMKF